MLLLWKEVVEKVQSGERAYTRIPDANGICVSDRLRAARRYAGLSRPDLAQRLGIHRVTVWKYEREKLASIDSDLVRRWAVECGAPYEWIRSGRGVVLIPVSAR